MNESPITVLAHGVFDVIHHGHIAFLEEAAKLGNELIVSITDDEFVNKGPGRPVFKANERAVTLLALKSVDRVIISQSESAVNVINDIKPDFYVKGLEYSHEDTNGMLQLETDAVIAHGGMLSILDTPIDSSSRAINIDRPTIPEDAQKWVADFKKKFTWEDVQIYLDEAATNDFSIIGERIIDKYVYVEGAGQSPKEGYTTYIPTDESDEWEGGVGVIRDHVQQISENSSCPPVISGCVVTKTRYVQQPFLKKVFSKAETIDWNIKVKAGYLGIVENRIIADFGHGLFDKEVIGEIYYSSGWIAATIQANSLNFGFNRINKWDRLDYISCDRTELELANPGAYNVSIDHAVDSLAGLHDSEAIAVTMGHLGARLEINGDVVHVPAFNDHAADRIGAGDAWFGWTAPLVRVGAPIKVIAFVGTCAAAIHVSTIGNKAAKANEVHGFMKAILS